MTRPGPRTGCWTRLQAAGALLLAGSLMAAPVVAKNLEAAVSPEMATQKARMLTGFFSSDRLRQAMAANPEAVAPLETEARAKLAAGQAALDAGQAAEAVALFDAGMRAISRAVALGSSKSKWDAQAASVAFVARRRHAELYLSVLENADDITAAEHASVAGLRARLGEADRYFANGAFEQAGATLDSAYRDIVDLVTDIRRGRTVVVSKIFETPHDEFEYERQRNQSYVLLVQIALAERAEEQLGLAALAARLTTESAMLHDQAEREAEDSDFVAAIATMERATQRLLVVLRASGLIMME